MLAQHLRRLQTPVRFAAIHPQDNEALVNWLRTVMGASHVGGTHEPVDTPLLQAHYQARQQHPQMGEQLHNLLLDLHGGHADAILPYADFAKDNDLLPGQHLEALQGLAETFQRLISSPGDFRNRRFMEHFGLSGDIPQDMAFRHGQTYANEPGHLYPEFLRNALGALPLGGPRNAVSGSLSSLREAYEQGVPLYRLLNMHDTMMEQHHNKELSGTAANRLFTGAQGIATGYLEPHLHAANNAGGY